MGPTGGIGVKGETVRSYESWDPCTVALCNNRRTL